MFTQHDTQLSLPSSFPLFQERLNLDFLFYAVIRFLCLVGRRGTILNCVILYYIVSYYDILYYVILYCTMLCNIRGLPSRMSAPQTWRGLNNETRFLRRCYKGSSEVRSARETF